LIDIKTMPADHPNYQGSFDYAKSQWSKLKELAGGGEPAQNIIKQINVYKQKAEDEREDAVDQMSNPKGAPIDPKSAVRKIIKLGPARPLEEQLNRWKKMAGVK
jgi:hypothetical protein